MGGGQILNVPSAYIAVASERVVHFSLIEKKCMLLFLNDRRNSSPLIVFAYSPSKCTSTLDRSGESHSLLLL